MLPYEKVEIFRCNHNTVIAAYIDIGKFFRLIGFIGPTGSGTGSCVMFFPVLRFSFLRLEDVINKKLVRDDQPAPGYLSPHCR